ncbi:MAG: zinc ribbon domain-containing protein [Methanomassiliicoccaceae archaeon]|nr:zinc ribbon domain-containing protein [Methanomassiliicoccaceae archaeon]
MRYICPECGADIPEEQDFCYSCGRKKDNTIRLDESGRFVPPETDKCASCGAEMKKDDLFCPDCGERRALAQMAVFRPQLIKYGWIGVLLAFIPGALGFLPGLFSIFGLGHLYFRKWTRGGMFLLLSVFMIYIKFSNMEMNLTMSIIFSITSVFIYLLQAMEVLVLAFMPPKTAE